MNCPRCHQEILLPQGPTKAALGALVYEPGETYAWFGKEANAVFAGELYRLGISAVSVRLTGLWGHPEKKGDEFAWHFRRALKAVLHCKLVILFGTSVTEEVLDLPLMQVVGRVLEAPLYLPGKKLLPLPTPGSATNKPLGEYRWGMERLAKEINRL